MSRDEKRPPIRSLRQHLSHLTNEHVRDGQGNARTASSNPREDALAELHTEAREFEPERWDGLS